MTGLQTQGSAAFDVLAHNIVENLGRYPPPFTTTIWLSLARTE